MPRKSLRICRGRGLLANDNPAFRSPSRRIVGVFILGICSITTALIGIGCREYVHYVRKMVCEYGVDLRLKYKPGFSVNNK